MSRLPASLRAALTSLGGEAILGVFPVRGGMISHTVRVERPSGPIFVKWNADAPDGFFAGEAYGLDLLRASGCVRVPRVIAFEDGKKVSFLALEYIEQGASGDAGALGRHLGEALAALHRGCASPTNAFGLDRHGFIGKLPQVNAPRKHWVEFYRECRLLPQIEEARRLGRLGGGREAGLMRLVERLEDLLDGLSESPSLLHGDLWSGNYLAVGDEPVLIDPAAYYGEREIEIAYTEMFGGFPPEFLASYDRAFPLEAGYTYRRPVHQLYPALCHLNHFGETYGPHVDRICARYARP